MLNQIISFIPSLLWGIVWAFTIQSVLSDIWNFRKGQLNTKYFGIWTSICAAILIVFWFN